MTTPFDVVAAFYGDRCALRSRVPLINHIKEGLVVLDVINATQAACDAFCLHPLFQDDADLAANLHLARQFDPYVMTLVMEYRQRAKDALSWRVRMHNSEPVWRGELATAGPLLEVRDMLIADKVQNYADFLQYHHGTHERSEELDFYFQHWLAQLNVSRQRYQLLVGAMKAQVV
jgi:hypothetical protein